MHTRGTLIVLACLPASAVAAPTIDPQFGTHSVIQRDKPILLTGQGTAGEQLSVGFAGEVRQAVTGKDGRWKASFTARPASGPFEIAVTGPDGTAASSDVMVGDVWLCSGQSNMEYPLPRAMGYGEAQAENDPELRLAKVPHQLSSDPRSSFTDTWSWNIAAPEVKDFSAACYFMVHELRTSEKVPIGAIDDSWGGTPIRAWMNEASVRSSAGADMTNIVDLHRADAAAGLRAFGTQWAAWWRSKTGDRPGLEPWNASARLTWKPVPSLTYWDNWGAEWKNWIGSAWLRERVTLTGPEAAHAATLSLSAIDDLDETFVNGVPVGGKDDPTNPRSYALPKGVVKPGTNEIMIFTRNLWGQGGVAGPADKFALIFSDRQSKPLTTGWEYSRIPDSVGDPPVAPWDGSSGVSTIYNAMVAPLGSIGLKGVAWYQGEADVGKPRYDLRLAAWMANWRSQFGDPNLPFLVVGLAGWGKEVSRPVESDWASLINEQRLAVSRDPHTALASAIDLGNPEDIHPADKQKVGRRLALAAHHLVYHDGGLVGVLPLSAVRQGQAVLVTFTKPLQILSGANANAFELCGPSAGSCRYADARVDKNRVTIAFDNKPVTRVRYAWADYPVVNLYDLDMLPVPVFEIPVQ